MTAKQQQWDDTCVKSDDAVRKLAARRVAAREGGRMHQRKIVAVVVVIDGDGYVNVDDNGGGVELDH